ncbi:hypothetical protein F5X99DRAFT_365029 [Biscogniauxia marginata]|nr:hypothetical protein F5X99DRAFT_365029 [Biscogniauxia marginata]
MAPRRVIADSDDEDGGDEPLSPLGQEIEPPQPEPLSPQHRPSSPDAPNSHNHVSDTTDPSFFADVYSEQQNRALQQSHLIENIVRQSQKASASSGEAGVPSSVVLDGLGNQEDIFNHDPSEFNTPRKGTGEEWEVPSSPEDATSRSVKRSNGTKERTHGKRKKSQSNPATKTFAAEDDLEVKQTAEDIALQDGGSAGDGALESSLLPATETRKISLHDSVVPENKNFYVAQSNLTTMQRLEYQKVNVSQNGYPGLPGSLSNQKSSCATTIAYPTPSRYASSGPPLPWERPATATQEDSSRDVIDITSSPDVIGLGYSRPSKRKSDALQAEDNVESPVRSPSKLPSAKRDKKKPRISEDADELGQDEAWDSDTNNDYQENYKPRPSRRRIKATTIIEDGDIREDAISTTNEDKLNEPAGAEMVPDAPDIPAIDDMEAGQPEPKPATQPKKRGRKKKQLVLEETPQDIPDDETPVITQERAQLETALQTAVPSGKPKKKRGRPRKSDSAKAETAMSEQAVSAETLTNLESYGTSTRPDDSALESSEQDIKEHKTKKMKVDPKQSTGVDDQAASDDILPLKDVDRNTRSPSKTLSPGAPPTKAAEESAHETQSCKSEAKKTPNSTPGSKAPYRVGLSKRSRIAPLLKIIRK